MYLIRLNVSYSVLNTHRSMLMQTVPYFGVASCNKSNLISRVMKGYFNIKPVQYKPKTTWDVSKVLNYISSLYPLQSLCLKLLTFKLITLVALTTAARAETLAALDLRFMSVYHDKVCFDTCTLLKTSRPGRQNPKVVLSMFDNLRLCVVTTLKEYVKRTVKLRKSSLLFVSFITFQAVCTSTLAR